MHEMSLAEGVLQLIEDTVSRQDCNKVKLVVLEIGQLATVEPEAMRFCFDAVTRGSIAEGATLEIIEVVGQGWCMHCAETVNMHQKFDACPQCGSYQVQVTAGDEMRLKELEIE